jgi:diguanylate cyclase (GGDEF)-like protein/PAS domain S-box-containing protein
LYFSLKVLAVMTVSPQNTVLNRVRFSLIRMVWVSSIVFSGWLWAAATDAVERHPLELQALLAPDQVLRELPGEIAKARQAEDQRTLVLLYLAKANACRVLADWSCQKQAALMVQQLATKAQLPLLLVRGQIAQARALMALQDLSGAEKMLSEAQLNLVNTPSNELGAEVNLAFSSFSDTLGKHALSVDYANRGLALLSADQALPTQVRLLRNRSRSQGKLGLADAALKSLEQAELILLRVDDPKLDAEIHLELARVARLSNDVSEQIGQGQAIMVLAQRLNNAQLKSIANEVIGTAQLQSGDLTKAQDRLLAAWTGFRDLSLRRDELRVLRALVQSKLNTKQQQSAFEPLIQRFLALQADIEQSEKANAADDFDARLKYVEQKVQLTRLEGEAKLAREREKTLTQQQRLTNFLFALIAIVLAMLTGFLLLQRRWHQKLRQAFARTAQSELSYRTLADNARDVVVRVKPNGERVYVSMAVKETLGWDASELVGGNALDLIHPDDRANAQQAIAALLREGGSATMSYRVRHRNGEYLWLEVLARLTTSPSLEGKEIVYSGRDITARVRAEAALRESEHRLRAITDNIPALIAYIDGQEKYRFANAYFSRAFNEDHHAMLGRSVRELRGEAMYQQLQPQIQKALQGESVSFEGNQTINGKPSYFQSLFCPDINADGKVVGFFALTFDITELKYAQQELEQLARFDSLTGLANRLQFDERMDQAIKRCKRKGHPLALLALDVDQFKAINDSQGHPFGDAVIKEFAKRLRSCVREEDLLARIGGDEFVLLIENAESEESVKRMAEKLLSVVRMPVLIGAQALQITTSIGIAFAKFPSLAEPIITSADRALYAAKSAGRDTYRVAQDRI